jgi:hypothetical protein
MIEVAVQGHMIFFNTNSMDSPETYQTMIIESEFKALLNQYENEIGDLCQACLRIENNQLIIIKPD